MRRPDGRLVRFDDNAAVLLNNKREMLGTRIGGVVSADLRMKGWGKIVSLAPKVCVNFSMASASADVIAGSLRLNGFLLRFHYVVYALDTYSDRYY